MIVSAKGITNGIVPLGAVFVADAIHDTIMDAAPEGGVEFYHGYTYSANPVACAAGLATLDIYEQEGLLERASGEIGQYWEDALHGLQDLEQVIDVRNYGLIGAVQFAQPEGTATPIGGAMQLKCYELGVMIRAMGNIIAFSPPLTIQPEEIDQLVAAIRAAVAELY